MRKRKFSIVWLLCAAALLITAGAQAGAQAVDITTQVVSVFQGNSAPVAQDLALNTALNVAIGGTLSAVDPDGDAVTYTIVGEPEKGTVQVQESGEFVYTPAQDKKGKDSFTFIATDANGVSSNPAKVSIRITKLKGVTLYADMMGNAAHYAALVLAQKGVYRGEQIGDACFFNPDEPVTRSRFLAMCMQMRGTSLLEGVTVTGFSDDGAIAAWAKSYVSTAVMNGNIHGTHDESGHLVFDPEGHLTVAQASMILNSIYQVTPVSDQAVSAASTGSSLSPDELQAVANLTACGILPGGNLQMSKTLTMADAAMMLCAAEEKLSR